MKEYINKQIKCFNPSKNYKNTVRSFKIYHYTSPQGLYGILNNENFRFTDCQFLNDKSEYMHIIKQFNKALGEVKNDLDNEFKSYIISSFKQHKIYSNYGIDDIEINNIDSKLSINFTPKRYYVFCTSTSKDSLGMWNYYVKDNNYQGYNIEISMNQMLESFKTIKNPNVNLYYGKVLYNEREQIKLLKELLINASTEYKENLAKAKGDIFSIYAINNQSVIGSVLNYIENYRLFFKDEAFINENEYRFVLKLPLDSITNSIKPISHNFIIKNGIFTPFCELPFDKTKMIKSITLSPILEWEIAKQGLERYLKHHGYNSNINIVQSVIPIRN